MPATPRLRSTGVQGNRSAFAHLSALRQGLLLCGIISALLYASMLIIVPGFWPGYSSAGQTVSELSAIGAPSRQVWLALARVWAVFYLAFGIGIWRAAASNRALRAVGAAIILSNLTGFFWPPMHLRTVLASGGATLTDTLHIVWTAMNGVFTLLAMGFGAAALRGRFRSYTVVTMMILMASGVLTSRDAPRVSANLPTPWIGVWERINIGAWLLWVAILSMALLSRQLLPVGPGATAPTASSRALRG